MQPRGTWMGKLVREPLLHFALAAVLIGGLHRWHARNSLPEIRVTQEQADALLPELLALIDARLASLAPLASSAPR